MVRVPVWWGDFYTLASDGENSGWRTDAFEWLDWLVNNCATRGLYVIVDMHGAVGSQSNEQWTGQQNRNAYWTNGDYQGRTAWMWWQIANHFRGNPTVAGYDLLNEPTGAPNNQAVWTAYNDLYHSIRSADPDHMLFMEGTFGNWGWNALPAPSTYGWVNIAYEMHEYQFNQPLQAIVAGAQGQVSDFNNHKNWNVPAYLGEFNDFGSGPDCWKETITLYNNAAMNWSMWSYKATHGPVPDSWGIYDPLHGATVPNIYRDSAATIAADWQQWQTPAVFTFNDTNPCPTSPLPGGTYTLSPACAPGSALNASGTGTTEGTAVNLWTANGSAAQKWVLINTSGNMYQIAPAYDLNLRLDVTSGDAADGTKVHLWTRNDTPAQQWFLFRLGIDTYTLIPEFAPNSRLDVSGGSAANGTQVQIWTANGTPAQTWTVQATAPLPVVTTVTLNPATLTSGNSSIATLQLSAAAPPLGLTVNLSSSNTARASVPAAVTVPAGATSATFAVTTGIASTSTQLTIHAAITSGSAEALLTLSPTPAQVASITVAPASIVGGQNAAGVVTLNVPAQGSGLRVNLASSDASVISVPASIMVPAGAASAPFSISTRAVAATTSVTITAEGGGMSHTRTLIVTAPRLGTITFTPASVRGGVASTGKITLSSAAPAGGLVITLSGNNTAAKIPTRVSVAAGATACTFTVATTAVLAPQTVTVTAQMNGQTTTGKLTVTP